MRALLDVNVIIALLDPDHAFHERAHEWWAANSKQGWASCPLTENGMVRILSNPKYSQQIRFSSCDLISRMQKFTEKSDHEFWPDDLSVRDENTFVTEWLYSPHLLTDAYLLA